jgi:hypothetical protein
MWTNLLFLFSVWVVPLEAILPTTLTDSDLSGTSVTGLKYGSYMETFAVGAVNYLLVAEGSGLAVDVYSVTSTAITRVQRHTKLATTKYFGFSQAGDYLIVEADQTSSYSGSMVYSYSIFAYPLSSLVSTAITTVASGSQASSIVFQEYPLSFGVRAGKA